MSLPPEVRAELADRLQVLHRYFPEMKRRMKIGITRSRTYDGMAFETEEGWVQMRINIHRSRMRNSWRMPTNWTLGHEMMHLAQFNTKGIPGSERACDMFALARLAPELIDESPSYLVVPPKIIRGWRLEHARLAHDLAREALARRSRGLRQYALWWEEEFERRSEGLRYPTRRRTMFKVSLLRTSRSK